MYQSLRLILIISLLVFSSANYADEDDDINWSIKGFGTLGLAGTDTRALGFYRERSETQDAKAASFTTDSRLGLQLSADFNPSLNATVQWVARDHAGNFFEQNLDWAFLRWNIDKDTTLRLGRLGADAFLLSDYRNVGYAYPWMRPPHEFYASLPVYHFDGMDINKKISVSDGALSLKLFGGYSFSQYSVQSVGLINTKIPLIGSNIGYESGNWNFRASYIFSNFKLDSTASELKKTLNNITSNNSIPFNPPIRNYLSINKNSNIQFYTLGAAYDDSIWLVQGEADYVNSDNKVINNIASAYLSIGRRFSTVTLYSLYGFSKSFSNSIAITEPLLDDPNLAKISTNVNQTLNQNNIDEQSVSVGLRWDFYTNMAFKTQLSHYWLGRDGKDLWQKPIMESSPNNVNVWSVGVDFIF